MGKRGRARLLQTQPDAIQAALYREVTETGLQPYSSKTCRAEGNYIPYAPTLLLPVIEIDNDLNLPFTLRKILDCGFEYIARDDWKNNAIDPTSLPKVGSERPYIRLKRPQLRLTASEIHLNNNGIEFMKFAKRVQPANPSDSEIIVIDDDGEEEFISKTPVEDREVVITRCDPPPSSESELDVLFEVKGQPRKSMNMSATRKKPIPQYLKNLQERLATFPIAGRKIPETDDPLKLGEELKLRLSSRCKKFKLKLDDASGELMISEHPVYQKNIRIYKVSAEKQRKVFCLRRYRMFVRSNPIVIDDSSDESVEELEFDTNYQPNGSHSDLQPYLQVQSGGPPLRRRPSLHQLDVDTQRKVDHFRRQTRQGFDASKEGKSKSKSVCGATGQQNKCNPRHTKSVQGCSGWS